MVCNVSRFCRCRNDLDDENIQWTNGNVAWSLDCIRLLCARMQLRLMAICDGDPGRAHQLEANYEIIASSFSQTLRFPWLSFIIMLCVLFIFIIYTYSFKVERTSEEVY